MKNNIELCDSSFNMQKMCRGLLEAATFEEPVVRAFRRDDELHLNKVEGILLGPKYPDVQLTIREAHSCLFLMLGFTSKEIASKLNLSSRTVEHYISCAKVKLSLNRKSSIIRVLLCSDFITNLNKALD